MFIELDKVPREGLLLDRTIPAESLSTKGEDFRLVSGVELKGRLQPIEEQPSPRSEGTYRLRGRIACRIELACVRCLEPVILDIAEDLNLLYLPQSMNAASSADADEGDGSLEGRGLDSDELVASFYLDERIDLEHAVLEQIVLALPMKPLCHADCQGLCPQCGANRNLTGCNCERDETDPRWAKLKTLQ